MADKKEDSNDWKVRLKSIVLSLPEKPGSYQYLDKEGTIIYVGKAKNLKRRVSSYFNKDQNRKTAMLVSRFRAPIDIIGMTTDRKIWRRLSMSWGVTPVMAEQFPSMDVMFYYAKKAAIQVLDLQPGDNILLTGGTIKPEDEESEQS